MENGWTAEDLLSLARAYQPVCVLGAAADLELFEALGDDSIDAAEAAERISGDRRATTILLDALAALGLLLKAGERYSVPARLRTLLRPGHPDSVLAMVQHQASCLRRWIRIAETVRSGAPPEKRPGVRGEAADRASFIEAMDVINRDTADGLVTELMPLPFRRLLDVGGASGTWTAAWLRANPEATAILFDLPPVIPLARDRLGRAGLLHRVSLVAGDFEDDALPEGADLAWVSAIVHQNSREQNRALFTRLHQSLRPGGGVIIRDVLMDETRTRPAGGALFAVNMLVATAGGGTYTFEELRKDLEAAGFRKVSRLRDDPWMNAVVGAMKTGD